MSVRYDLAAAPSVASVISGVAAFDPVTLKIAAEAVAEVGIPISARAELDASLPRELSKLAHIALDRHEGRFHGVKVRIDTGHMTWDDDFTPERDRLQDYRGRAIEAVGLSCHPLIDVDGRPLTRVRMFTPAGHPVWVWFTELSAEADQVDGWELLALAQASMDVWEEQEPQDATTVIRVPVLDMEYETLARGVECGGPVMQRFQAVMDETGAQVIAETMICAGLPFDFTPPPVHEFGAQGPVCLWFSEDGADLPFSIIYTSSEAWEESESDEFCASRF